MRWLKYGLAVAAVIIGGLYVAGHFLTGARLPQAATIAGVDVGGMSPDDAEETLAAAAPELSEAQVTVAYGDHEFTFAADDLGLDVDVPASVANAGGERTWNPVTMYRAFFGDADFPSVNKADHVLVSETVLEIADEVNVDVIEAEITFEATEPVAQQPEAGVNVDRDQLGQTLVDSWINETEPVRIPAHVTEPQVTKAQLATAMTEIAEPAVSGPVVIDVGDKEVELPVTAFAPALTIVSADSEMVPRFDVDALKKPLTDSATGLGESPVDAHFVFEGGKPVIVEGKPGIGLEPAEMAEKLLEVITESGEDRRVEIDATVVDPALTAADLEKFGVKEKISEFTTYYPPAEYRNVNQSQAAKYLSGTIVQPGETFSYDEVIGPRTPERGFVKGVSLANGVQVSTYGGGVSQVATTIYNAAFFAGLEDVYHKPHSFYISRYPEGREATVSWQAVDLKFRNNLKNAVLIRAWVVNSTPGSQGQMHVEMWGTKEYDVEARKSARYGFTAPKTRYNDKPGCISQSPSQGFKVDVFRDLFQNGKKVRTEKQTATYIASDRVVCGSKPS